MNPYDTAEPDFSESLTLAAHRLNALQKVKLANEHLREIRARAAQNIARAESDVVDAMKAASALGAYSMLADFVPPPGATLAVAS